MKINKRSLLSIAALALTISVTAFGTVAYMTDSDQVTNKFTVGNINITVDETNVDGVKDENGVITPARDQQNSYELIPGLKQVKDPTVTIAANSEECYVRMRVEMNKIGELKELVRRHSDVPADEYVAPGPVELLEMFVGEIDECWDPYYIIYDDVTALIEFRYEELDEDGDSIGDKTVPTSATDTVLPPLFETFTVPIWMTGTDLAQLKGFYLNVYGDAVQTASFDDADAAWDAYDYQVLGIGSLPEATETAAPSESPSAPPAAIPESTDGSF